MVNVRELSRNTSKVIEDVAKTKRPTLVTRDGRPVAALYPVEPGAWEDWVLENAPEFVTSMREAEEDMKAGRAITLDQYFASRTKKARPTAPRRPSRAKR
jgi:prevent-host-death family protein